jgi:hypothetical protein
MWQTLYCPSCGYGLAAGDRFCGNCGINLTKASIQTAGTQEIIHRKVEAYHKLYPSRGSISAVQSRGYSISNKTGTSVTPIRGEIIKLLSSLLNN